ncbi:hypothetical protein EWM62_09835 [Mucilaginibacter terrigena]|uniref:Neutral/alkaline non-lysosomal ceramidase N-terminal domain-containing protein n=1 Tax=Mucilaginibacter terrigena TaxID=2492395 RepID=A0A4Q5LN87_9SPHI|nr:hypothetical protein [Mucilaginibacter terrigena]RYU90923.1 hypothetical protein EWM62_09835 [Mucilaginibacter terrigena]
MKQNYFTTIYLFLLLVFLGMPAVKAQETFLVGAAKVSIDPDSTVFSVPLAGYGAPRDGRFSIEWKLKQDLNEINLVAAAGKKLYAVNAAHELLVANGTQQTAKWKKAGTAKGITAITGTNTKLYALQNNNVVALDLTKKTGWKKIGIADNANTLTVLNGKLYAANIANELLQGNIGRAGIKWKTIGKANNIVSLVNDGSKIYGVDANDTLYSVKPGSGKGWLKIGTYNATTYDIKIKQLLVFNKRLYALNDKEQLFMANHSTDNTLSARALAIKSKNKTVIIVTLDLTGFDYSLGKDIKDIIYKKRMIPQSAIIINGSHTHFAPVTQWFPTFGDHGQVPDSIYFNNILKRGIVKAIEGALDHMEASTIYFGRGSTNIGHNRSSADGETPYDGTLDVLKFENNRHQVSNLLFLTGCHPVFKNDGAEGVTVSANYPGVSRNMLEEKTGSKTALFVQGCAGDINPRDDSHQKTGTDLGNDVLKVLNGDMPQIKGDISYTMDTLNIPTHPWSKEKVTELRTQAVKEPGNVYAEKDVRWANLMLGYYQHNSVPQIMPVYVQTITIGNWKLVGLSREVVTEYGPAIRAVWPDKYVSVAGYCNDVPSYLPIGRHINAQTYEGYDSFFWNAQPSLFPVDIFDTVMAGIIKIKNR